MPILGKHLSRHSVGNLIVADYKCSSPETARGLVDGIPAWLPSAMFYTRRVAVSEVAAPSLPHTPGDLRFCSTERVDELASMLIVIDQNVFEVGKAPNTDFVPRVIVVSGTPGFLRASAAGVQSVLAYVGNLAMEELRL